jgi:single-strand DNA-binding protein
MASINKVILIGHVGKDPEVRFTQSGQCVASFSVATSESYKKGEEKIKRTEWHRVVAWGKLGEIVERYLKKGTLVFIEGKIQTRSWEKDGKKQYSTEIVAATMQMLSAKAGSNSETQNTSAQPAIGAVELPPLEVDDDIPF